MPGDARRGAGRGGMRRADWMLLGVLVAMAVLAVWTFFH